MLFDDLPAIVVQPMTFLSVQKWVKLKHPRGKYLDISIWGKKENVWKRK